MIKNYNISELIYKFTQDTLSESERLVLDNWLSEKTENQALFSELLDPENIEEALSAYHPLHRQRVKKSIWRKITPELPDIRRGLLMKKAVRISSIVAAAVLIISFSLFFLLKEKDKKKANDIVKNDIVAPATNKATITLADGQKVSLDSAMSGTLAMQGSNRLIRQENGALVYQPEISNNENKIIFNTLENPRGSKVVNLTLSDGTHVWLNAGSAITYPVSFSANERSVSLKGEAYFDVSHNASRPFIVNAGEVKVQVLGTGFDVNAYSNNNEVKITLLKGAVKLESKSATALLTPGQQAKVKDKINVSNDVDIETVMAWKNNRFIFDNTSIEEVMKQVENWYDVNVVYEVQPPKDDFFGSISRNVNLSQILALLTETRVASFEIRGKTVIVKRASNY